MGGKLSKNKGKKNKGGKKSGNAAGAAAAPAPAAAPASARAASNASNVSEESKDGMLSAENEIALVLREKRANIFSEQVDFDSEYVPVVHDKSDEDRQLIQGSLRENFLFSNLEESETLEMENAMEARAVANGEMIIQQGDTGDNFYVVQSGAFDIFVNDEHQGNIGAGGSFGELALLYNCPRAATIKASEDSSVFQLDRRTFRHALARLNEGEYTTCYRALRQVPLLEALTDKQISTLANAVKLIHFKPEQRIISKGEAGNVFYLIKSGTVSVTGVGEDGSQSDLSVGEYFGERALMTNEPRAATVTALTDVSVMALDRISFNELLGPLHTILERNLGLRVLASVPILSVLDDSHRTELVGHLRTQTFTSGQHIIRQGEPGSAFYIVSTGEVAVVKSAPGKADEELTRLTTGSYFGEMALLSNDVTNANVIAQTETTVFSLDRQHFNDTLGPLQELIDKANQRKESTAAHGRVQVNWDDLEMIQSLGQGTFGLVKLVRHKPTGTPYALKILQKQMIVEYGQQANVLGEKNVMVESDHPFILKLVTTFKDPHRLYMLLELVQGGELFTYLHVHNRKQYVSSDASRFYSACVLLAFQYIHSKNICYRDLKPENLMVDADGYVKVVDFGFAKVVTDRTYTLCGTPEYLAPELVLGKGHNKGVDYWALGVLIYEMLCGYSPFADPVNCDEMTICRSIVRGEYTWPKHVKDATGKDIVRALLTRDPNQRIGCLRGGAEDIKRHAWYSSFDFGALLAREIEAPWVPPCRDAFDCSNFDQFNGDDDATAFSTDFSDNSGWDADF